MAATRESYEFSLTIRPGDISGVCWMEKDLLKWAEAECSHFVIAYEQKGDLSTQHFQAAMVFNSSRRADNLKATLVGMFGERWSNDQKRHAILFNKNRKGNDIRLLAGGYCMKQDVQPFIKGWTLEELEPFQMHYEELKSKAELRNISREKIVSILKDQYDSISLHKNPDIRDRFERVGIRQKLDLMYRYLIAQGADLQKFSTPVWINYFIANFDVLFQDRTAEGLLEYFSSSPV